MIKFISILMGFLSIFFMFLSCISLYTDNIGFMFLEIPSAVCCYFMCVTLTEELEDE